MTISPALPKISPVSAPVVHNSRGYFSSSVVYAGRSTSRIFTDRAATIQSVVFPVLTLTMFSIVLGDSVTQANKLLGDGRPSIFGYVALVCLTGGMSGSISSAVTLQEERSSGLLSRFWTMPVHRAADLTGRLFAETLRISLTVGAVVIVGAVIGFRFHGGAVATVIFFLLPILFCISFALVMVTLAGISNDRKLFDLSSVITLVLMFFNSGFVPLFAYPTWLQPIVGNQPLSVVIDAMNALAYRGEIGSEVVHSLLWSFGLMALFAAPAVLAYRRAAQSGGDDRVPTGG